MDEAQKFRLLNQLMSQNKSNKYQTNLDAADQFGFANWANKNNVPVDLTENSDYDMPGFYKAMQANDLNSQPQISPLDNQLHFTDRFKTPLHETFSNESQYADENAPHWEGNSLRAPTGELSALELPGGNIVQAKEDALKRLLGK